MTTHLREQAKIFLNNKFEGRDSNQSLRKKDCAWKTLAEFIGWLEKREVKK